MKRSLKQQIEQEDAQKTVGSFLREQLGFSEAQIRSLKFRERGICVNGEKVRVTKVLQEGDLLEIEIEESERQRKNVSLEAKKYPIEILYEDADVICVWKPAGVVTHPAGGYYRDSMANYLTAYFQEQGQVEQMRSIGRLDKGTSGILVFAKNQMAAARLWKQREEGIFTKEYLALCEGEFLTEEFVEEQKILSLLQAKTEQTEMGMCYQMEISEAGKRAETTYRALQKESDTTLVRVHLQTGRMHQIRVHMASIGHPLLGDALYGNGQAGSYAKLCAWKCRFRQPFDETLIQLQRLPEWGTKFEANVKEKILKKSR